MGHAQRRLFVLLHVLLSAQESVALSDHGDDDAGTAGVGFAGNSVALDHFSTLPQPASEWNPVFASLFRAGALVQTGGLSRWLASLKLIIPSTTTEQGGYRATFEGVCKDFSVSSIQTKPQGALSTHIDGQGLSLSCELHVKVSGTFLPEISTYVTAAIKDSDIGGTLSITADAGFPKLPASVGSSGCVGTFVVDRLKFSGAFASATLQILEPILKAILNRMLGKILCGAIDKGITTEGSEAVQNASAAVRSLLAQTSSSQLPPSRLPEPHQDFIGVATNPGVRLLSRLFNDVLGNPSSPYNANLLAFLLLRQGGNVSFTGMGLFPLQFSLPVGTVGSLNITLHALSVAGLDSWKTIALNGRNRTGTNSSDARQELRVDLAMQRLSVDADITLAAVPGHDKIKGGVLEERFRLVLNSEGLSIGGTGYAALNSSHLAPLAIDQLPKLGCIAPSVYVAELTRSTLNLGKLGISLQPRDGEQLERDLDSMLNVLLGDFLGEFSDAVDAIADHVVSVTLKDMLNSKLEDTLSSAGTCPAPEQDYVFEGPAHAFLWTSIATASVACFVIVLTCMIPASLCLRSKLKARSARTASLAHDPEAGNACRPSSQAPGDAAATAAGSDACSRATSLLEGQTCAGESSQAVAATSHLSDCLALHPRMPKALAICVPLLIIATMCLFIASNLCAGAIISLYITVDGEAVIDLPPLFKFSLLGSVRDMWNAEVYFLAVIILVFSGIWPYVKLVVLLFCWVLPTSRLSLKLRQMVLDFLDAYGKWSIVDSLFLVIFMVAFHFEITPEMAPDEVQQILHEVSGNPQLYTYVQAGWGFYCFLLASMASLVLGMVTTACHRYALQICEYAPEIATTGSSRLCNVLRPPGLHQGRAFVYGPVVTVAVSLVLVCVGVFLSTFEFEMEGMLALILGPERSARRYSIVELGLALPASSLDPTGWGVLSIQAMFFMFVILFVVAYHVVLIVLWCAPLPSLLQRRFLITAQVMNAWNGLDVFTMSILASVLELQQFAKFIVADRCDLIDDLVARTPLAAKIPGGPKCFDVQTRLEYGFWILALAAIISSVTGQVTISRCSAALCGAR